MHIAASRPLFINEDQISQEILDKEKEIYTAQAQESGKPADIAGKMVEGRLKKFIKDLVVLISCFVMIPIMIV